MGRMKKKYESGEASQFLTRKHALRKLQLSLKAFRKLCILKGIYPREPKNRKRAQKGATDKKTLYLKKDIQFLLHEPIVWKLRDHKVYLRKKASARGRRDMESLKRIIENKPTYKLDHIVRERYPTFIDAIRDLDDCLTLTFLFSTFPSMRFVPGAMSKLCRRLTVEFMHYVIEAKALRKVFVSIKGYYYQAEIKGQTITWIVPHNFAFQPQTSDNVDFRIMATFVEFYATLLGFVNFRLFHALNVFYPPKLVNSAQDLNDTNQLDWNNEEDLVGERVAALNQSLAKVAPSSIEEAEIEMDEFEDASDDAEKVALLKKEAERIKGLKTLFSKMKIFLSREVPRESLTFVIRAIGGQVSWDSNLFAGATFSETDETITHQIVDRDSSSQGKKYLSRYYVQPQWVFDCVNARAVLPVEKYFPDATLPPHLSPFATEREGDYMPPEKKKFLDMEKGIIAPEEGFIDPQQHQENESDDEGIEEDDDEEDDDDEVGSADEEEEDQDESGGDDDLDEDEKRIQKLKKEMKVTKGEAELENELKKRDDESKEQWKLRCMMIRNKHKRLYKKMMDSRRRRRKEADRLSSKRLLIEKDTKKSSKGKKKGVKV